MAKVLKAGEIKMLDQLIQQVGYNFNNAADMIDAVEKELQTKRKGHNLSKIAKDYIEAAYLAAKSANTNNNETSATGNGTTASANNDQSVGQMGTAAQDTTTGAKDIPNSEPAEEKSWDWSFKVNPNKIAKNITDGKVIANALTAGVKAGVEVVLDKKFNTGAKVVDEVYKDIFRGLFNF